MMMSNALHMAGGLGANASSFSAIHLLRASRAASLAVAMQDPANDQHLLVVFVGIAAVSLAVLTLIVIVVLLALAVVGLKARSAVAKTVDEVKGKAFPIIEKTNAIMGDMRPRIVTLTDKVTAITGHAQVIAGHAESIAGVVKDKVDEFAPAVSAVKETVMGVNDTARDVNAKAQAQVKRVDGMITEVITKTERLAENINRTIHMPGREVAGVVSGFKAAFESLTGKARGFGTAGSHQSRSNSRATTHAEAARPAVDPLAAAAAREAFLRASRKES